MKAGLDIGTSKISLVILNEDECVFSSEEKNFFDEEKRQDPNRIYDTCLKLINEAKERGYMAEIVGVSTQMHGILYVDENGEAVSDLYTWQDDKGNFKYGEGYTYSEYAKKVTGYNVPSGYGLITHFYLFKNGLVPKTAVGLYTIGDYVYMKLNGLKKTIMHPTDAASLGFYDIEKDRFDLNALKKLDIDCSLLPAVGYDSKVMGDNQASFMGAVGVKGKTLLINIGTGGQVSMLIKRGAKSNACELRPFNDEYYLAVGSSVCGGYAYAILGKFFKSVIKSCGVADCDVFKIMNEIAKEETTMEFETAFCGKRDNVYARAKILNVNEQNFTAGDMVTACINGIVTELKNYYDDFGEQAVVIVGAGGGIKKNTNMQKAIEKIFGKKLIFSEYEQDAAIGVAKM